MFLIRASITIFPQRAGFLLGECSGFLLLLLHSPFLLNSPFSERASFILVKFNLLWHCLGQSKHRQTVSVSLWKCAEEASRGNGTVCAFTACSHSSPVSSFSLFSPFLLLSLSHAGDRTRNYMHARPCSTTGLCFLQRKKSTLEESQQPEVTGKSPLPHPGPSPLKERHQVHRRARPQATDISSF